MGNGRARATWRRPYGQVQEDSPCGLENIRRWSAGFSPWPCWLASRHTAQAEDGQFYGLMRERDLTPFGFMRLDMRPAHAVSTEPGSWAVETDVAFQNTWALSPEVEKYLTGLGATGRRQLGPEEVQAIRDLPGENYLVDLEAAVLRRHRALQARAQLERLRGRQRRVLSRRIHGRRHREVSRHLWLQHLRPPGGGAQPGQHAFRSEGRQLRESRQRRRRAACSIRFSACAIPRRSTRAAGIFPSRARSRCPSPASGIFCPPAAWTMACRPRRSTVARARRFM